MSALPRFLAMLGLAVLVVLAMRTWERERPMSEHRCSVGRTGDAIAVDPPALRLADPGIGPAFRDVLVDRHELRPDRRFLFALVLADCLVTERQPTELQGSFTSGAWSLTYRGQDAGTLRALPDFGDALALVSAHVRSVATEAEPATSGSIDAAAVDELRSAMDRMEPAEVTAALERIDALWRAGHRDRALLEAGARGLVALTLLGDDPLELADPLAGRALAALAIARELGGSDLRREEALLALRMGYAGHAHAVAGGLPEVDPARLYVLGDKEGLRRLAESPGADGVTTRLADGLPTATPEYVAPAGDLSIPPFLPTGVRVALYVAELLVQQHGLDPAGSAAAFERDTRERSSGLVGPFLDGDTYASYLAAAFYAEVYRDATGRLQRGSATGSDGIVRRLDGADTGIGAELAVWYAHLASRSPVDLESDLAELDLLGPRAVQQTFDALAASLGTTDPRRQIRATHVLARRLDSRVDHLFILGSLAGHGFYDPATRERVYRRAAELAGPGQPRLQAWMAMYEGDGTALERMSRDPEASIPVRAYALDLAARQRLIPAERWREAARALIGAAPLDWDVHSVVLDELEDAGDVDAALELAQDFLDRSGESLGLPRVFAHTAMARLLQSAGRLDEAYAWIDPVVGSGQNGAIGRAALIQAERGDPEAIILAQRAVERYPQSAWSRSVLAEVYWRLGRPNAAADAVRDARSVLGAFDWRQDVARAFADAFRGRPVEEAVSAMQALRGSGIPPYQLLQIALGLHRRERTDLAFELTSRFAPAGSLEGLQWMQRAYGFLAELEGEARATEWYVQAMPPGMEGAASMFMFSEDHHELLWTAIPGPAAGADASWIWLMRAAGFVRSGGDTDHHRRLMDHFAAEDGDPYHHIGRYLMDLEREERLLERVTQIDRLAEVAFYVGLKAQAEGRMRDAIEWYRVVLDTGLMQEGEYRWALDRLWTWSSGTSRAAGPGG